MSESSGHEEHMDQLSVREACAACFAILGSHALFPAEEYGVRDFPACTSAEAMEMLPFLGVPHLDEVVGGFEHLLLMLRTDRERYDVGMYFTPQHIVDEMIEDIDERYSRVVDCGCGAGRFSLSVALADRATGHKRDIVALDADPLACLFAATAAKVLGLDMQVIRCDYLEYDLPAIEGATAFVGNPPYARHHCLTQRQKDQGVRMALQLGLEKWSRLAGLHALFILKSVGVSRTGDVIRFITGSEWTENNYGASLRELFVSQTGGGRALRVYPATSEVFTGVMSSALISTWCPGTRPGRIDVFLERGGAEGIGVHVVRCVDELAEWRKWDYRSLLAGDERAASAPPAAIELGSCFRVSRGTATGCNGFFVMTEQEARERGIFSFTVPVIARASDVPSLGEAVDPEKLCKRLLQCEPGDPDKNIDLANYLVEGANGGINDGYVVSRRTPWWSIATHPAPIVATYMGRGRPRFALNPSGCPSLNTVHGLYPRHPMSNRQLEAIVGYLNSNACNVEGVGRTYQGGLIKFEPREMERIALLPLEELERRWGDGKDAALADRVV